MMLALQIATLGLLIGLAIWQLFVSRFLPSYLDEKAKNLATKEDIKTITEKVEAVRSDYAKRLESFRSALQIEASVRQVFGEKCLLALERINQLLVEITKHCWSELAKRSGNEHYVWESVAEPELGKGFHYYRVATDKLALEEGLYLSSRARRSLGELAEQLGLLSSMELALMDRDPDPMIEKSAESGYQCGLEAVERCRTELFRELGLNWANTDDDGVPNSSLDA